MQQARFQLHHTPSTQLFALLICALIFCAVCSRAQAQSGRHAPKRSDVPPISAPPATDPVAQPSATKPEPARLSIVLANETSGMDLGWTYARIALSDCERRLRESAAISVQVAGREMNRKEAHDRAKTEKEAYVVLLQLQSNNNDMARPGDYRDLANAYINYIVFTPSTAKTKTQGRVYLDSVGSSARMGRGRIGLPMPGARRIPFEYLVRLAAQETADRLMAALNVPPPSSPF